VGGGTPPDGGGPTTGGGTIPGPKTPDPNRPKPKSAGGIPLEHWMRWWQANRLSIVDVNGRVLDRVAATPSSRGAKPRAELWRAEAQEVLTLTLSDGDDDVASGAAIALGKAGDPADATPLIALLGNARRGQMVREGAAIGLGLIPAEAGSSHERSALELVASDVRAPDRLRAFAVYALGLRGEAASAPFLLDSARSAGATWDVAAAGASALGLTRCPMVREDLERILAGPKSDRQSEMTRRVYAAHGLARLGDPAAIPALREAALDEDANVRRAAILALGALAPSDDTLTAELLARVLRLDKDRGCRNMAAIALARSGPERAVRELRWAYDNGDSLEQPFAAIGLGIVARRGKDPEIAKFLRRDLEERANSDFRGALCIAVGLSGDAESAPVVRRIAAERGDPEVRAQAATAIGLLDDRDAGARVLRTMLRDAPTPAMQREAAHALGMLGDREAVNILLGLVKDGGSVYVQGSAAVALGRIGGAESYAPLAAMLRDKNAPGIGRAMATVALGLLLDRTEGRRISAIGADLDWYALTPAVQEILDIL
jgi:HEAT repeat protein